MVKKLSSLWILTAGILWGTMGIFVRRFNNYGIKSMSIVFIRSLLTALIIMLWLIFSDRGKLKIRMRDLWIFAGMGVISIVFFNYCYFTAISLMSLSTASILLYTSPIFVMLLSALIYKEKITLRKIAAAVLSLSGLMLVTGVLTGGSLTAAGIAFGIGSAIGYALYSIFSRAAINRGYDPRTVTCWAFAFAALLSFFGADLPSIVGMISVKPSMIGYTVMFSIVASVAPYILYSLGLEGTETGRAGVIASAEPVAATAFGMIIYHEYPSASAILGIALVIFGLALAVTGKNSVDDSYNKKLRPPINL